MPELERELVIGSEHNMNTHLKTALLTLSFIGTWRLTLTIKSGYAGSRIAATPSNTIVAGSSARQWVWQNPLPQGNTLQDFSFIDTNNGFAVGARGTILKGASCFVGLTSILTE